MSQFLWHFTRTSCSTFPAVASERLSSGLDNVVNPDLTIWRYHSNDVPAVADSFQRLQQGVPLCPQPLNFCFVVVFVKLRLFIGVERILDTGADRERQIAVGALDLVLTLFVEVPGLVIGDVVLLSAVRAAWILEAPKVQRIAVFQRLKSSLIFHVIT